MILSRISTIPSLLLKRSFFIKESVRSLCTPYVHTETFEQGQVAVGGDKRIREYFYYIDHQGQLFLEGTKIQNFTTCYKDVNFLVFFFKRLKRNETERYHRDFPYVSPCGREMNYIRCESLPVVFTDIIQTPENNRDKIGRTNATPKRVIAENEDDGEMHAAKSSSVVVNGIGPRLAYPFEPEKLCMLPKNGRVYHPAPLKVGGAGILKTSLCIEFSELFSYKHGGDEDTPPSHFVWQGVEYELTNELWEVLKDQNVEVDGD